jgi:hypothetical protein
MRLEKQHAASVDEMSQWAVDEGHRGEREIDIPSAPMTNTVGFPEPLAVVVVDEVAVPSAGVDIAGLSSPTTLWGSEGFPLVCACAWMGEAKEFRRRKNKILSFAVGDGLAETTGMTSREWCRVEVIGERSGIMNGEGGVRLAYPGSVVVGGDGGSMIWLELVRTGRR